MSFAFSKGDTISIGEHVVYADKQAVKVSYTILSYLAMLKLLSGIFYWLYH